MLLVVLSKYNYSCLQREKQIMVSEVTVASGLLINSTALALRGWFVPLIRVESSLCARYYYKHMRSIRNKTDKSLIFMNKHNQEVE